jgi:hypothetical protein
MCAELDIDDGVLYAAVAADADLQVTRFIPVVDSDAELESQGLTSVVGIATRVDCPPVQVTYAAPGSDGGAVRASVTYGIVPAGRCSRLYIDSHVPAAFAFNASTLAAGTTCVLSAAPGNHTASVALAGCRACPTVAVFEGLDEKLVELDTPDSATVAARRETLPLFVVIESAAGEFTIVVNFTSDGAPPFRAARYLFETLADYVPPTPNVENVPLGDVLGFLGALALGLVFVVLVVYIFLKEWKRRKERAAAAEQLKSIGPSGFTQTARFVDQTIAD